jgi:hypothetical protein
MMQTIENRETPAHDDDRASDKRIIDAGRIWMAVTAAGAARSSGRPQISRTSSLKNNMQPNVQHVIEMVAAVKPADRDHFTAMPQARRHSASNARAQSCRSGREGRGEIGAEHIERAMRQVHRTMMPKISVKPARAGNSSMPKLHGQLRHCSRKYSMALAA